VEATYFDLAAFDHMGRKMMSDEERPAVLVARRPDN
jgi:hypothetical protein